MRRGYRVLAWSMGLLFFVFQAIGTCATYVYHNPRGEVVRYLPRSVKTEKKPGAKAKVYKGKSAGTPLKRKSGPSRKNNAFDHMKK